MQGWIAPPASWLVLHPIAWVPAFVVFSRTRGARAFLCGWLVGAVADVSIFYWLVHTVQSFTNLPALAALPVLGLFALGHGLYAAVFAWGFGPVRRAAGGAYPLALAAWFTACEFANPQLFPYFQGVAWYELPRIFLVVSFTGVAGVTFLVMLANGVVLQALEARRGAASHRALAANAAVLGALLLVAFACAERRLAAVAEAERAAAPLRVALVQPNYDLAARRRLRARSSDAIANDLADLSRRALAERGPIDAFVWPERILPGSPLDPANAAVLRLARESGAEVWTGGASRARARDGSTKPTNSAFRVLADGSVARRYDKIRLLLFGETVPFEDVVPALRRLRGPGRLAAGDELVIHDAPAARFAFLICYEAILPDFVRGAVRGGAELLVNLTYDGWYGDTSEPHQHLMLAAVQAAQFGVPLVRATTTGISATIDARGVVRERTGLFTREVLVDEVRPLRAPSLYAAAGDWLAWGCVAASALLLVGGRLSGRRAR